MAHSIYADEMTTLMYGSPLWEPDMRPEEVSLADVGYIRNGRFNRLFNATLRIGDPANHNGVPDGYEPMNLDERATVERRLPPGVIASRSIVKLGADIEVTGSLLQAGAGFHFSCKKDRGAILIINSESHRKDSEQRRAFKQYMLKHFKSWLTFANEVLERDIALSDLCFVTGRDNTADWAVAAFVNSEVSGGVSFEAGFPTLAGAKLSIWGAWKGIKHMYANCGPTIPQTLIEELDDPRPVCAADLKEYNQCIFLRGFRVMDRKSHLLKLIKVKVPDKFGGLDIIERPWVSRNSTSISSSSTRSGTSSKSSTMSKQNTLSMTMTPIEMSDSIEIEFISDTPETFAPIDYLLAYILLSSRAEIAIAHDDDVTAIIKDNEEYSDFAELIFEISPPVNVDEDGVGTPSPASSSNGTSTPIINIPQPEEAGDRTNRIRRKSSPKSSEERSPHRQSKAVNFDFDPQVTPRSKHQSLPPEFLDPTLKPRPQKSTEKERSRTLGSPCSTKFDRTPFDQEQARINSEINSVSVQLVEVQNKISSIANGGPGANKENALRIEIDNLRNQQAGSKIARAATVAEINQLQEEIRKKAKEHQTLSRKLLARTIADLDSQISTHEQRIEQGLLKFSEEKKAVNAVSHLRRSRPQVESYVALGASLAANRNRLATLQRTLDAPLIDLTSKIEDIRSQLETLGKERQDLFDSRPHLFTKREELIKRREELYEERRQVKERLQAAQEAWRHMEYEERAKQAELSRRLRHTEEEKRRKDGRERLLQKARTPIFSAKKRDCKTLLDFFSVTKGGGMITGQPESSSPPASLPQSPQSATRDSNEQRWEGWIPLKGKKDQDEDFFVSSKGKTKKGKRHSSQVDASSSSRSNSTSKITIPLGIMNILISLEITPPSTTADVPRTVDEIQKKLDWLNENEAKETEENVTQMRAFLQRVGHSPISV